VQAVSLCDTDLIKAQIAAIRADIDIHAVKIGMLGDAAIIRTVAKGLEGLDCPVVLDPVMVAKGGDRLLQEPAITALRGILPLASVLTPNLPEAADLLESPEARSRGDMVAQARALLDLGPGAILLKGGHLPGDTSPDLLLTPQTEIWFETPRTVTRNTHGTGCTLSSALATALGAGLPVQDAVAKAKRYISAAIATADWLDVGAGHGPVNHFHAIEQGPE
jgi:hydroxymethylpyrimidine/phosphomethylpyrimidine kinase